MTMKDITTRGEADFVSHEGFREAYAEPLKKFIYDAKKDVFKGNENAWKQWSGKVLPQLTGWIKNSPNDKNTLIGASGIGMVATATFLPEYISLITGPQLKHLTETSDDAKFNREQLQDCYVLFGVQANGNPQTNPEMARSLLQDYKQRGIKQKSENPFIVNFPQLRLQSTESGLVFKLAEDITQRDLIPALEYNLQNRIGKDGAFGAGLLWSGHGYAYDGLLAYSGGDGRVVCYVAKGDARKNLFATKKQNKA